MSGTEENQLLHLIPQLPLKFDVTGFLIDCRRRAARAGVETPSLPLPAELCLAEPAQSRRHLQLAGADGPRGPNRPTPLSQADEGGPAGIAQEKRAGGQPALEDDGTEKRPGDLGSRRGS